jgi:hypothetical protein
VYGPGVNRIAKEFIFRARAHAGRIVVDLFKAVAELMLDLRTIKSKYAPFYLVVVSNEVRTSLDWCRNDVCYLIRFEINLGAN